MEMPRPISAEEFTLLMAEMGWGNRKAEPLAVAVSGGPDSLALAFCLARWHETPALITALIVDHRLRANSAAEAEQTLKIVLQMGLGAKILVWQHEKQHSTSDSILNSTPCTTAGSIFRTMAEGESQPVIFPDLSAVVTEQSALQAEGQNLQPPAFVRQRIQERARFARHDLLQQACIELALPHLFFAHQADDQAETVLMRLCKGSGIEGLAAMTPQNMHNGINYIRPFLQIEKTRLIATCDEAGLAYAQDPGNLSPKFARGRLRAVLPLLAREGLTPHSLCKIAEHAAEVKLALEHYANENLAKAVCFYAGGDAVLNLAALTAVPQAVMIRMVNKIFAYVHPSAYAPQRAKLLKLLPMMAKCTAVADGRMHDIMSWRKSLHGCLISRAGDKILFQREPAAAQEILPISLGQTVIWDDKWLVAVPHNFLSFTLNHFEGGADFTSGTENNTDKFSDKNKMLEAGLTVRALGFQPKPELKKLAPWLHKLVARGQTRASLPSLWVGKKLLAIPYISAHSGEAQSVSHFGEAEAKKLDKLAQDGKATATIRSLRCQIDG